MDFKEKEQSLELAEFYFKENNLSFAQHMLDKVIKIDSKNSKANELLSYIYARQGKDSLSFEVLAIACSQSDCSPEALYYLGASQLKRLLLDDAIKSLKKSILKGGEFFESLHDLATAQAQKGDTASALYNYQKCLHYGVASYELFYNIARTFDDLKQYNEAIFYYDKALSLKPDFAEAWANKGLAFNFLKEHAAAIKCYQKSIELKADDSYLFSKAHYQMMLCCDWTNYEKDIAELFKLINEGRAGSEPFSFQGIAKSEELLKRCAEIYSNDKFPALGNLIGNSKYQHNKIRIGYLCGEFRNQATTILMIRIWELHDKSKFEIFAFDNGWDDESDYRQRIKVAFDNLYDVSSLSDIDAAKLIQSHEIDILINLNGFFGLARQGVFSFKPSPIQVNYLGFPGTIGAKYMDYIIADSVVIPDASKKHYTEKVVNFPNSYQANDNRRIISEKKFSKAELGLPENSFIFACFNNSYKITPGIYDSWAKILMQCQNSILWLLVDNAYAKENLIKAIIARNIDSSRLVFAERMPLPEHLSRHRQADLFLDTLPYNAHTTASDALWAGLPVLTLMGSTFPGRVSSSLLRAVGLEELITKTQEEYESLAIELAMNPKKLSDIKLKLANNRLTTSLFDSSLFTKNLETAYFKMYERYQGNLEPDHITIV